MPCFKILYPLVQNENQFPYWNFYTPICKLLRNIMIQSFIPFNTKQNQILLLKNLYMVNFRWISQFNSIFFSCSLQNEFFNTVYEKKDKYWIKKLVNSLFPLFETRKFTFSILHYKKPRFLTKIQKNFMIGKVLKYNYIFTQKYNLYFWYFDIFTWKIWTNSWESKRKFFCGRDGWKRARLKFRIMQKFLKKNTNNLSKDE